MLNEIEIQASFQEEDLISNLKSVEGELEKQKQINSDLEELNTKWANQNVQINKELVNVKVSLTYTFGQAQPKQHTRF